MTPEERAAKAVPQLFMWEWDLDGKQRAGVIAAAIKEAVAEERAKTRLLLTQFRHWVVTQWDGAAGQQALLDEIDAAQGPFGPTSRK